MLAQVLLFSSMTWAAPVVTQGINSRRIAPGTAMTDSGTALNKTVATVDSALVNGFGSIKVIRIGNVEGPLDKAFKDAAMRSLNSTRRIQNIGTVNAVAGTAVGIGGKVGARAAKQAIRAQGGMVANFAAKKTGALIEQQSEKAAKDIKGGRFDPEEAFTMDVATATLDPNGSADAVLSAKVTRDVKHSNFKKKKKDRNKKGKVIKNQDGKPKFFEAKCIKRTVNTTVLATLHSKACLLYTSPSPRD